MSGTCQHHIILYHSPLHICWRPVSCPDPCSGAPGLLPPPRLPPRTAALLLALPLPRLRPSRPDSEPALHPGSTLEEGSGVRTAGCRGPAAHPRTKGASVPWDAPDHDRQERGGACGRFLSFRLQLWGAALRPPLCPVCPPRPQVALPLQNTRASTILHRLGWASLPSRPLFLFSLWSPGGWVCNSPDPGVLQLGLGSGF